MITKTFTDIYGDTHTDALITVTNSRLDVNSSQNFSIENGSEGYTHKTLDIQVVFHKTQEDKDNGLMPRILLSDSVKDLSDNPNQNLEKYNNYQEMLNHRIINLPETYQGDPEALAYKYLEENL